MYGPLLKQARSSGVNTLVVDVQPSLPPEDFLKEAKSMGFYLVSRVVVFEGGLRTYPAPPEHVNKVIQRAEAAATLGFMEIQLDYIRFADKLHIRGLTLTRRYRAIASILQSFEKRLRPHGVRIGADIFGRIPFNKNDIIGQKMEVFAPYLDTIYPMLYPSHFYGDPFYQKNPYRTIYDGKTKAIRRAGTSRIIAYIQGFTMYVGKSGLSYKDYIKKQILAARDSGGAGFIVWNPKNQYGTFFQALEETN
ncbi:MAG: glycosyl hydrolase [Leptospiraceae bacterium]|nr:glycosyl hydrolase [Leptospiraceae bacterium]